MKPNPKIVIDPVNNEKHCKMHWAVEFKSVTKDFITKRNEVVPALADVSFALTTGEFVAIVGPSGCGKSTTLNLLAGLTKATEGQVLIDGQSVGQSNLDVGYIFQQDTVLPWKAVVDNIQIGLRLRKMPKAQSRQRADELLKLTGLAGFENAFPAELSGGMRKRVALATALAYDPALLLMDEPFGALDAQTRVLLQDELLKLWHHRRPTVVFVTHDIGEAIALADRVIVMSARPARISTEYKIDLPRPRSAENIRFDPRFEELNRRIWNDLKPEITEQARLSGERA